MDKHVDEKDYMNEYYELDYDRYVSRAPFSLTRIKRVMGFLEPKKDDVVADIGCGIGTFTLELAPLVKCIYAVDFSSDALDILKRMKEEKNYHNINIVKSSVEDINIEDRTVDTVVSADLVEHLYDEQFERFVSECRRILKPGGCLLLYTPNIMTDFKKKAKRFYKPVKDIVYKILGKGTLSGKEKNHNEKYEYLHVGYKSMEGIISSLEKKGFVVDAIKYYENPLPFPFGNLDFIRKNFAKRYLVKCTKK